MEQNHDQGNNITGEIDFGVKKVYKSPKSIHRADAKGLTSSSKLSVSCVLTLQTLPLITFTYGVLQRIGYYPKGYSNSNNLIAVELETK